MSNGGMILEGAKLLLVINRLVYVVKFRDVDDLGEALTTFFSHNSDFLTEITNFLGAEQHILSATQQDKPARTTGLEIPSAELIKFVEQYHGNRV
jgi:hypothetical protein